MKVRQFSKKSLKITVASSTELNMLLTEIRFFPTITRSPNCITSLWHRHSDMTLQKSLSGQAWTFYTILPIQLFT